LSCCTNYCRRQASSLCWSIRATHLRNPKREACGKQHVLSGLQLQVLNASSESEIDKAFRRFIELRADALIVSVDSFLNNQRAQIVALAARHAVTAIYGVREFATSGGLMSYGNDLADAYRQSGIYAAKILKGAKPAELPVEQVVRVEFLINLKTAGTLGVTFPITLLGRADEVIE